MLTQEQLNVSTLLEILVLNVPTDGTALADPVSTLLEILDKRKAYERRTKTSRFNPS